MKITVHFEGGLSSPTNSCICLAFQILLTLPPKYFVLLSSTVHYYMVIETFLNINYTISVLH